MREIPDYFYIAFVGELTSVFGTGIWTGDALDYLGDCAGVVEALKMTCRKLDMMWLYHEYCMMEWYDSDRLIGELTDGAKEAIQDWFSESNSYYLHLLEMKG